MQSTLRSLAVLEAVSEHQPVGVGELSRLLGLPKTTVQRSLVTLASAGWLRPVTGEFTRWALTSKALAVGRRGSREVGLREAALEPMQRLRDETNETIHLAVPDGLRCMVLVERMDSTQPVRTFHRLGAMTPLHATSTGRSVLAHLPADQLEEVITRGLEPYSKETLVEPEGLRLELGRIREQGYSVNLRQYRPGVAAVGAPIFQSKTQPVAGICISMPDSRFSWDEVPRWGELVAKTAAEISSGLDDY